MKLNMTQQVNISRIMSAHFKGLMEHFDREALDNSPLLADVSDDCLKVEADIANMDAGDEFTTFVTTLKMADKNSPEITYQKKDGKKVFWKSQSVPLAVVLG
jgi:hypothetical protein